MSLSFCCFLGDEIGCLRTHSDLEDDSPYPEVRAAVSNVDDPSMPVGTFRVCVSLSPHLHQVELTISSFVVGFSVLL